MRTETISNSEAGQIAQRVGYLPCMQPTCVQSYAPCGFLSTAQESTLSTDGQVGALQKRISIRVPVYNKDGLLTINIKETKLQT